MYQNQNLFKLFQYTVIQSLTVTDQQFGQLITISSHLLTILKTTDAEFPYIPVSFTDQNNRPLEIEDSVNFTLIIGQTL